MTVTTIDKVVRAAIAEAGHKSLRKYILFLHFAFDALYKNKRDNVMLGFRYINLPVVNRRAVIPDTVIGMGQLGWQRGHMVSPIVSGPSLSLDPAGAQAGGGVYMGSFYRIDRSVTPAEIVFDQQPTGDVYVEVIDQLSTPNTETIVTSEGVLPIKSYIHFRNARFKSGAASAEAREAEREYLDEMDEAMASLSDLTPGGIWYALSSKQMRSMLGLEYPFFFGTT